ncbi:mitochondrial carrier domain-containing protein [Cercophora scortea]|uniref:Mitochondrial carrier domain-containing protein n=1 Tax=Cercophora scortea TaxID=314031 RepID=A0AAE0MA04_9PEZI|nr:mitochondrial carrier domain-containing protein [Cercophora scortea]
MGDNTQAEIIMAGALAAFTVDLLVYPLDTIKTRYQSQDYRGMFAQSVSGSGSGIRASRRIFKGLYQGIGSVIFATLPAAGIFFVTYESVKPMLGSALPSGMIPQPAVHALASGTAELASCLVLTPAEIVKQNAQVLQKPKPGGQSIAFMPTSMEALRMVWRSAGGPGRRLWAGYTALAARNLPFTAMQFPMFEFVRDHLWRWRHRSGRVASGTTRAAKVETGLVTGVSAALSGAVAAVITTPTDVVKTRMMLAAGRDARADASGLEVAKAVFRERGLRGLFRGALLRASWTALGSGLYLGSYEVAKSWLRES